jgi:DNA-binding XRE family transcriptional regulator
MQTETLNISYHVQRMVLKALNKCKTKKEAAQALGVTTQTLNNYEYQFSIERDSSGRYVNKKIKYA